MTRAQEIQMIKAEFMAALIKYDNQRMARAVMALFEQVCDIAKELQELQEEKK